MQCEQARQLFDAYLDGELSSSLATELGAHRVRCADCRQALALLEVSGHILRSDREPVQPSDDFTDRLLACVDSAPGWRRRILNTIYIGGPLAAAAVIALAFIGVFDGKRPSHVAGVQEVATPAIGQSPKPALATPPVIPTRSADPAAEQALGEFIDQTQQRMKNKGESVQRVLDLTVLQMLDILEDAKNRSQSEMKGDAKHWNSPAGAPPTPSDEMNGAEEVGEDAPEESVAPARPTDPLDD